MVHCPAIMLANLKAKWAADLASMPSWFHLEFVRQLLRDRVPTGIDASDHGKLVAQMWLVNWCDQANADPHKLHNLVKALNACYERSLVFTTRFANEYSFASFKARELGLELISDLRMMPGHESQVHVIRHATTGKETVCGQLWLPHDAEDAHPLLVVKVEWTPSGATTTDVMMNDAREEAAIDAMVLFKEFGFVHQQNPRITNGTFQTDMIHLIRQSAIMRPRVQSAAIADDFGTGTY